MEKEKMTLEWCREPLAGTAQRMKMRVFACDAWNLFSGEPLQMNSESSILVTPNGVFMESCKHSRMSSTNV